MLKKGTVMNLATAKTSELVQFWNANAPKFNKPQVSRFSDRKAAEARCAALLALLASEEKAVGAYKSGACPNCGSSRDITCGKIIELRGKQVVVDEHKAFCHHCGHEFNFNTGKPLRRASKAGNPAARAENIARSWSNKAVRAARLTRHSVVVKEGKLAASYTSVRAAFAALALPMGCHIAFRGKLKAAGKAEAFGRKWEIAAL